MTTSQHFIDETFLDINDVKNKTLQPIDINKRLKQNKGINKRTRFSIIHCGSINGFVTDAQLVLMDKEINAEIYEHYLRQTLLPKLPPKSIVVLDNSGPHSRRYNKTPNTSTNKDNIKKWLKHNNIPFEDNLNKKDLLLIVKKNPIEPINDHNYC